MVKKKYIAALIVAVVIVGVMLGYAMWTPPPPGVLDIPEVMIFLWENGEEHSIAEEYSFSKEREMGEILKQILHKVNLQARCVLDEERIQEIKMNNKVLEVIFRPAVLADIPISQWIEPEDRNYIPTNKEGYRILEDIDSVIFILESSEDNLEGYILIASEDELWGCWIIQDESEEIDKTWISQILNELEK